MPTNIEYTLLAGAAYTSTRSKRNQIREPQGWISYWPPGLYAKLLYMVLDFADVKQTFNQFNCVNKIDDLLVNEVNEVGQVSAKE